MDAVDSQKGRTALHRAIKGSVMMYPMDAKVVTLLLESGASPFSADKKGGLQTGHNNVANIMQAQ